MLKVSIPIQAESDALVPTYATTGASGADARASLKEPVIIPPASHAMIPTGIKMAIPEGYEIQVRPRSGLAAKNGVTVLNTPGTIDADYRGEVCVILINLGKEPFIVTPGMRIAQFVLCPVVQAEFVQEETLSATVRGGGGFGHTGTK